MPHSPSTLPLTLVLASKKSNPSGLLCLPYLCRALVGCHVFLDSISGFGLCSPPACSVSHPLCERGLPFLCIVKLRGLPHTCAFPLVVEAHTPSWLLSFWTGIPSLPSAPQNPAEQVSHGRCSVITQAKGREPNRNMYFSLCDVYWVALASLSFSL